MPRKRSGRTDRVRKETFLIAYGRKGQIKPALQEADISYKVFKTWLEQDPVFKERYEDIKAEIDLAKTELLEDAAIARAVNRSDQLLKFLLENLNPAYKERYSLEHEGKITVQFKENLDLSKL